VVEEHEDEDEVVKPAESTPASAENPNAPTLKKAATVNGLTVDVSKLQSDFIELGPAEDMDGDSVTITA
jgi:hypothetical protein